MNCELVALVTSDAALLLKARDYISDPDRWTKGSWARNTSGDPCSINDDDLCSLCAEGALLRAGARLDDSAHRFLRAVSSEDGYSVPGFNDNHEHGEVVALFNRAIKLALERGQ